MLQQDVAAAICISLGVLRAGSREEQVCVLQLVQQGSTAMASCEATAADPRTLF